MVHSFPLVSGGPPAVVNSAITARDALASIPSADLAFVCRAVYAEYCRLVRAKDKPASSAALEVWRKLSVALALICSEE